MSCIACCTRRVALFGLMALVTTCLSSASDAQDEPSGKPLTPGPMLAQGTRDFDTPDFTLTLVRSSQTVAALKPKNAGGLDFTPGDLLAARSQNGFYHLRHITP